ncbi:MAG TPA: DUF1573 domain-containing protein [Pirellulales bacterium]|nr:DUF1573 domain-containing protein [Pirellulales bacterium]
MRIPTLFAVSVVLGLALGLGSTVYEFGLKPDGQGIVEFGPSQTGPKPPPLVKTGPPPKMVIDDEEYKFGRGEKGVPQSHVFVVHNAGQGPLELVIQKTSCKCTKAEVDTPKVAPGGSAKITLEWDTKQMGAFRQSATLFSNDPEKRAVDLLISGEIVSSFRLEPERIVLTNVSSTKPTTATARLYGYGSTEIDVKSKSLTSKSLTPFFDVAVEKLPADELKQEVGAKSGCLLRITVKPGLPAGPFEQRILLRLNLPGDPEAELPVEGKVNGPIEIVGRMANWDAERGVLDLGQIHSAEGAKAELTLIIREGAREKVNMALAPPSVTPLVVTVGKPEKLESTTRIPVTIEVPRGTKPVNHLGQSADTALARIVLDTGLPEPKQLRISVQYLVEE